MPNTRQIKANVLFIFRVLCGLWFLPWWIISEGQWNVYLEGFVAKVVATCPFYTFKAVKMKHDLPILSTNHSQAFVQNRSVYYRTTHPDNKVGHYNYIIITHRYWSEWTWHLTNNYYKFDWMRGMTLSCTNMRWQDCCNILSVCIWAVMKLNLIIILILFRNL